MGTNFMGTSQESETLHILDAYKVSILDVSLVLDLVYTGLSRRQGVGGGGSSDLWVVAS